MTTPNTSATGGYLIAAVPGPLEGQAFEDFLQDIIVGISGLEDNLVFPRWQPDEPNLPDWGKNWAAYGIMNIEADSFAYEVHDPLNEVDQLQTHSNIDLLISFYGPLADTIATLFRDGLQIPQNRETLQLNGIGLIDTPSIVTTSELIKDRWHRKYDIHVRLRRLITRTYPILDIFTTEIILNYDSPIFSDTINV